MTWQDVLLTLIFGANLFIIKIQRKMSKRNEQVMAIVTDLQTNAADLSRDMDKVLKEIEDGTVSDESMEALRGVSNLFSDIASRVDSTPDSNESNTDTGSDSDTGAGTDNTEGEGTSE